MAPTRATALHKPRPRARTVVGYTCRHNYVQLGPLDSQQGRERVRDLNARF